jgi:hypothetical protein
VVNGCDDASPRRSHRSRPRLTDRERNHEVIDLGSPATKDTRSNRVGCARKACADSAGTVAGKIFELRQFRHLCVNSTAGRPRVRIERARLLNSRHGRTCGWLDPVAIDTDRTLNPSAIITARASFRSCSKFPICLHRQAGAGLFRPLSDGKQRDADAWRLFYFSRLLRFESKICL